MILALTCMNVPTLWGGYYHYLYVPDEETKALIPMLTWLAHG